MSLIDRVSAGLDQIGKKTLQAIDESKLRIELGGVRRRKDAAARDLGVTPLSVSLAPGRHTLLLQQAGK